MNILGVLSADDYDGNPFFFGLADDLPQHINPALVREQNIQQDQIRLALVKNLQSAFGGQGDAHIIGLLLQGFA
ncbi:hypothetical protein D3C81_2177240 [compost metagenome]